MMENKVDQGRMAKVNRNSVNFQDNNLYQGDTFRYNKELNFEKRIITNPSTEIIKPTNSQAFTEDYTNSRPISRLSKDRTSLNARRKLNMNLQNLNQPLQYKLSNLQNSRDNQSLKSDQHQLDKPPNEQKQSKDKISQKNLQQQETIHENNSNNSKTQNSNNEKEKQCKLKASNLYNENPQQNTITQQKNEKELVEKQEQQYQSEKQQDQRNLQNSGQKQEIVNATFGGDQKFFQKQYDLISQNNKSSVNSPNLKTSNQNNQSNQKKLQKINSATLKIHETQNEQIVDKKNLQSPSSQDQYKFTSQSNQSSIKIQNENNVKSKTQQNSSSYLNQDLLNFQNAQENNKILYTIKNQNLQEEQSPIINQRILIQKTFEQSKITKKDSPFLNQTPIIVKKHNAQNKYKKQENQKIQNQQIQSQTISYEQQKNDYMSGIRNELTHHQKNSSQPLILLKSDSPERFNIQENRQQYLIYQNKLPVQNIKIQNLKSFQDVCQSDKPISDQESIYLNMEKSTETEIARLLKDDKNKQINEYHNEYIYTQQKKVVKKNQQVVQSCEIRKNPVIIKQDESNQINNYRLMYVKNSGQETVDDENNYFQNKQVIKTHKGKRKDGKMLTTDQNPLTYNPDQSITDSHFGNLSYNLD